MLLICLILILFNPSFYKCLFLFKYKRLNVFTCLFFNSAMLYLFHCLLKAPNLIMLLTSKATAWYSNGELLFISVANTGGIISCNVHVINMRRTIRKNQIANVITLFLDNEEYKPIIIEGKNLENCAIAWVVTHNRKRSCLKGL